jgi:acetyl coenzyme A synthetase (ADP forming)-like protein
MRKEKNLKPMLSPKSVAIIGASRNPEKVGHIILQNYIDAGYAGKIYPINIDATQIMGIKAYRSVLDVKAPIDLAVIAIPAEAVPEAMEECGKAGVKAVVVVSGGFAEIGKAGLQEQLALTAEKYGMPTLGPNCLGVMNPRSRSDTLFLPTFKISRPEIGGVSFMAQSGAVGSTVLDMISGEGFGLSKFISYGNAAHVDESDILNYFMKDKETKVIVMYLEGIKDGKAFMKIARKVGRAKPVIVLKAGKTRAGSQAAHSHTAALAGDYEVAEAAFRQSGFIIAEDISELLYYAKIFASEAQPRGPRVAIVTDGGGAGVLMTDAVASSGVLKLAEFSPGTISALKKAMPPLVNARNPLDLAGDADGRRYAEALSILSSDQNIDMLIVIVLFQTPGADSALAAKLIEYKGGSTRPMVVMSIGAEYTEMHKRMMERSGLPVYDSPRSAAAALAALYSYSMFRNRKSLSVP